MGVFSVVTTSYPSGVVTISSTDSTPYPEIQASMGSVQYGLDELYMVAGTNDQILQPLSYREYNVNGNVRKNIDTPVISPYQYQPALYLKPTNNKIVFNGNTNLTFTVLPLQSVRMIFYVTELANAMLLKEPGLLDDYFFKQQYDFFGGFVDEI